MDRGQDHPQGHHRPEEDCERSGWIKTLHKQQLTIHEARVKSLALFILSFQSIKTDQL